MFPGKVQLGHYTDMVFFRKLTNLIKIYVYIYETVSDIWRVKEKA